MIALTIVLLALLVIGWMLSVRSSHRAQIELILDDEDEIVSIGRPEHKAQSVISQRLIYWVLGAVAAPILRQGVVTSSPAALIVSAFLGALLGEIFHRRAIVSRQRSRLRSMEFHLPMAMEQIVMAVGSGLDILPAIKEASSLRSDPVSGLLSNVARLCENGIKLEFALSKIADECSCPSVKHAFLHIALAHKEGGEIVRPLRELSDATQSAYQDTVEEEIARLPVKAVLPLVLTFTGLIICFITVPLIQVSTLTSKVSNVGPR